MTFSYVPEIFPDPDLDEFFLWKRYINRYTAEAIRLWAPDNTVYSEFMNVVCYIKPKDFNDLVFVFGKNVGGGYWGKKEVIEVKNYVIKIDIDLNIKFLVNGMSVDETTTDPVSKYLYTISQDNQDYLRKVINSYLYRGALNRNLLARLNLPYH